MDAKQKAVINFLNIVCCVPLNEISNIEDREKFISVEFIDGTRTNILSVTDEMLSKILKLV